MQFQRLGPLRSEIPAVRVDGEVFDLRPLTADIDAAFLATDWAFRTRAALAAGELPTLADADKLRVGAPVARPGAVICIGQNYAAHAAESGSQPPTQPIIFFKHPNTVVGPYDDVKIPPGATKVDWEVELVVVIGREAYQLESPDDALDYVAGYTISNDVSEREWQTERSGGQWSKGKTAAGFNPLGPWLLPADEVDDVQSLRLASWVNGEPRQDSNTVDMIFSVAYLVWDLSQYVVLEPGDVINTGTPQGVAMSGRFPYLSPGDTMKLTIEGLGSQKQTLA